MQADVFFYIKANIIHFLAKKNQRKVWTGSLIFVFRMENSCFSCWEQLSWCFEKCIIYSIWKMVKTKTQNWFFWSKQLRSSFQAVVWGVRFVIFYLTCHTGLLVLIFFFLMGLSPQECLFSLAYPRLHSLCSSSILSFKLKTALKERKWVTSPMIIVMQDLPYVNLSK